MKTLTLTLLISLSVMAQPPLKVAAPPSEAPIMNDLTVDESNALAISFFSYYEARIAVLEALGSSKAGNAEVQRVQAAEKALQDHLANARKTHNVTNPACIWNFAVKKWQCPEAK